MSLILIAAVSDNDVIGLNGKVPWYIPEDMKRFKELTLNHPVIMGRKTYESIPDNSRPLPKRKNIILSRTLNHGDGIYIARNIEEVLALTENQDSYVIGGRKIYGLFLPIVNRMEITRVHRNFEGDTSFPEVNWNEWRVITMERRVSENENISYSFFTYERR